MTSVNSARASAGSTSLRRWYVPDAYIPPASTPPEIPHESICVLNDNDAPATFATQDHD
jgi:hypothetical protein